MSVSLKSKLTLILIAISCITFLYAPYFSSDILLPRTEELNYSLYPLIIFAKQILAGAIPSWFSEIGLGSPWPIPHTMSHTPLALLFAMLPVYKALGLLLATHTFIQAFFTIKLCEHLKLSLFTSSVVLMTVLLAAPIEYMIVSDAAAVYLAWTLLPLILFAILKLLGASSIRESVFYTALLALGIGYGLLNGHIGVFSTHVIGIAVVILIQPTAFRKKWPWFILSGILAIGMGAEKLAFLANELRYFEPSLPRLQYTYDQNAQYLLWNLFVKPFVLPIHLFDPNYWDLVIAENYRSRIITLGSPLCAFLLLAYTPRMCHKGTQVPLKTGLMRNFWLAFLICFLLQFIPRPILPFFISASWTFRDPATLFGILLGGMLCEFWLKPYLKPWIYKLLLLTHTSILILSAIIFQYGADLRIIKIGTPVKTYNMLSQSSIIFPLHNLLLQAATCLPNEQHCNPAQKRVLYDGLAGQLAHDGLMTETGLHLNSLPIHGFQEVSYLTKGISLDSIHPSQSIPYGMISTLEFSNYHYHPGEFNWIKESPSLVNLLGIRIVIGDASAGYENNGLKIIGTLPTPKLDKFLNVYSNPTAFPLAFFVDQTLLNTINKQNECNKGAKFTTCQDFSIIERNTDPWKTPIHLEADLDSIELSFTPSEHKRTILLSYMWRPEWVTSQGTISSFAGLMRVDVEPSETRVTLEYFSGRGKLARNTTIISSAICILFLLWSFMYSLKLHNKFTQR